MQSSTILELRYRVFNRQLQDTNGLLEEIKSQLETFFRDKKEEENELVFDTNIFFIECPIEEVEIKKSAGYIIVDRSSQYHIAVKELICQIECTDFEQPFIFQEMINQHFPGVFAVQRVVTNFITDVGVH